MSEYLGKVQSFLFHGRMMPFEVIKDLDGVLVLRSADLLYEARVLTSTWNEQTRRLELIRNEQSAQHNVHPT